MDPTRLARSLARIRVVCRDIVTWLTLAAGILTMVSVQVQDHADLGPTGQAVAGWAIRLAAWCTTAVVILRRTIPAGPEDRTVTAGREEQAPDVGD